MKTTKILISICVVLFLTTIKMTAQVTIGSQNAPNASAVLDLQTTNKGLLLPRVALTSTTSASPLSAHVAGMTVYNTATAGTGANAVTPGQYYNNGTAWVRIQPYTETIDPTYMVWVNTANPNSATAFDDIPYYNEDGSVNSAFTNDNTLKAKTNYFYVGTDGSSWIYNGTSYITNTPSPATEWYVEGTNIDAGNSKTVNIMRSGSIGIGQSPGYAKIRTYSNAFTNVSSGIYSASGALFETEPSAIKTSGTYYQVGATASAYQTINAGITNSGYMYGLWGTSFRRGANNGGTLNLQVGELINFGHYGSEVTGITNPSVGLRVQPYVTSGTITNMYDIYAGGTVTGGTITNKYGIYIAGTDKTNVFDGKVGIGTSTPSEKLHVAGSIRGNILSGGGGTYPSLTSGYAFGWNSINVGDGYCELVNYSGTGPGGFSFYRVSGSGAPTTPTTANQIALINSSGAYTALSDSRVKTNTQEMPYGLETILKLQPKMYDMHNVKSMENGVVELGEVTAHNALGLIAQEVYNIIPEVVNKPNDDSKELYGIAYSNLVPVLIKGMQDQQKIIEQLEARIKVLESK